MMIMLAKRWKTHKLELSPTVVGVLDALIGPEGSDGRQVVLEDLLLHHAVALSHDGPRIERHHCVAMLLIGRFAPWDVELLSSVHQHSNA